MYKHNLQDLFEKYISGNITPEEETEFLRIVAHYTPEQIDDLMLAEWKRSEADAQINEASLNRISQILATVNQPQKIKRIKMWPWLAAASVLLLIGIGVVRYTLNEKENNKQYSVQSGFGNKKKVTLPDQSIVYLNGGSTLEYTGRFNQELREVKLKGEAYFEVAKNRDKPFIIHCDSIDVRVVGTAFNVSSYGTTEDFSVAVNSGIVRVASKKYFKEVELLAGEKLVFSTTKQLTLAKGINTASDLAWKDGLLTFDNNTLSEVAVKLERWYNVPVQLDTKPASKCRFSGKFEKLTIQEVLDILQLTADFSYNMQAGRIAIKSKGCN